MNIGILLNGISYTPKDMRIVNRRDFRNDYQNFYEKLFNPLRENNEVFVYTTTYSHEYNDLLLSTYNPKKCQFLNYGGSDQRLTHIKSFNLINDENIDVVILTRFDIEFVYKITELNVDYDKVNFLFKLDVPEAPFTTMEFVTDNLIIFPKKFLNEINSSILDLYNNPPRMHLTDLHGIYKKLKQHLSEDNIHFIVDEPQNKSGVYYNLKRA